MQGNEIEGTPSTEEIISTENGNGLDTATEKQGSVNRFQRKEEPKNKQFTGRATETEAIRIQKAINAQGKGDIVRLLLACLNHIEADVFQTFKTKDWLSFIRKRIN